MRYPEKLIEGGEGVALDSAKPSPAEMLSVLSHCLPSLYRYAYRLLGNKADAEDAVQDALLAAYKHLNQFRGDAQLSTWLTTIVINCARMHLRKRSRYIHVSLDSRIGEEQEYPLSDILVDHRPNPEDECHKALGECALNESQQQDYRRLCGKRFTCGMWIIFQSAKQLAFWEFPSER